MLHQVVAVFVFLATLQAHAGFKGTVSFTDEERAAHIQGLSVITKTASDCLQKDLRRHDEFIETYGISAFFGDRSRFSKMSTADKRAHISSLGKNPNLLTEMEPTSCVGLTLKCLGRGFVAAGQQNLWKRLKDFTFLNGVDGTALQFGLRALGWKILYWNADVSQNKAWDAEEAIRHPGNKDYFWGMHEENWSGVKKKGIYYFVKVDDKTSLVNFGTQVPEAIKGVEFFVGTSHMGYHVFPGTFGEIIEGHSTRAITDPKTLQSAPFNPIGGGGPTDGEYRSGLVAVPPGAIP